jgi:hypothetical protein
MIAFDVAGTLHVAWQELADENVKEDYEIYHSASWRRVFLPFAVRSN